MPTSSTFEYTCVRMCICTHTHTRTSCAHVSTQRKRRDEGHEEEIKRKTSFIAISSGKSEATRSSRTRGFFHSLQVAQRREQLDFTLGSWDNEVDVQCRERTNYCESPAYSSLELHTGALKMPQGRKQEAHRT